MAKKKKKVPSSVYIARVVAVLILAVVLAAGSFYYEQVNPQSTGLFPLPSSTAAFPSPSPAASASPLPSASPTPSGSPTPSATVKPTPSPSPTPFGIRTGELPLPVKGELSLVAINVGQGDCLLVVSPGGKVMMIDAGTSDSYSAIDKYLKAANIKSIDVLVATHPHADHIGSMRKVIEHYKIGEIYMPRVTQTTTVYSRLLQVIKDKGKMINTARGGKNSTIPFEDGVEVRILAPLSDEYKDINNYSVVLHVKYAERAFLLTGDAEALSENEIVAAYSADELRADVLKVGHHGSSSSTRAALLSASKPSVAVISSGDNGYDHPHKDTVNRLKRLGCNILRTDILGTILISTDGTEVTIFSENTYQ